MFYCKQNSLVSCWFYSNIWRKKALSSVEKKTTRGLSYFQEGEKNFALLLG